MPRRPRSSGDWDRDHGHDGLKSVKVCRVRGEEREPIGRRYARDHQVGYPPARFSVGADDLGRDNPVLPGCLDVKRQRAERRFYPLNAHGPAGALDGIYGRMDPRREFGQADRADCELRRQIVGRQPFKENQDASVT